MRCKPSSNNAFTLIEVLVALVILAFVGVMLAQVTSQSVDQADYLKRKTVAAWVAQNRLTELKLLQQSGQTLTLGEQQVEQMGLKWQTDTLVEKQADGVVRIEIAVFQPVEAESSLFRLTGYLVDAPQVGDSGDGG